MARLAVIDDDYAAEILAEGLRFKGHEVRRVSSASEAVADLRQLATYDGVLLDLMMAPIEGDGGPTGGLRTGMQVYSKLREISLTIPIVIFSARIDTDVSDVISKDERSRHLSKLGAPSISDVEMMLKEVDVAQPPESKLQAFIVHGHDETTKLQVKNYLQNKLLLPEPIVLHEQPSQGRVLIEKFEDYASQASVAFVLLTPDDKLAGTGDPNTQKRVARQNVILELGYFLALFGRKSGRVFLLHKGPIELPSDISGIIYIDITNGVEQAGEEIRRELAHVK